MIQPTATAKHRTLFGTKRSWVQIPPPRPGQRPFPPHGGEGLSPLWEKSGRKPKRRHRKITPRYHRAAVLDPNETTFDPRLARSRSNPSSTATGDPDPIANRASNAASHR